MTAPSQPAGGRAELARRLRDLRLHHWPGRTVPQRVLAEGLGGKKSLSLSLISAWENETSPTMPPVARLREYATFFATERSIAGDRGRLVPEDELTADEIAARDQLYEELLALRTGQSQLPAADAASVGFNWAFPSGAPVRIVCGKLDLDRNPAHPYTNPDDPNYTDLLTFADVDALVELFGHLRKVNPDSDVRFIRSDRLMEQPDSADDLASHLILLGGIGLNALTEPVLRKAGLPIRQREHPDYADKGEVFEVAEGKHKGEFLPNFSGHLLVEDVGLLARTRNPYNSATTLTVCNGVFARGVLGAVRALTDDQLRKQNESYLASRFGGADRFAILMRVPVLFGTVLTPDLRNASTRLYEWRNDAVPRGSNGLERAG
jgi:hypothetical protein